jgi:hypothetical protein
VQTVVGHREVFDLVLFDWFGLTRKSNKSNQGRGQGRNEKRAANKFVSRFAAIRDDFEHWSKLGESDSSGKLMLVNRDMADGNVYVDRDQIEPREVELVQVSILPFFPSFLSFFFALFSWYLWL